MFKRMRKKWEVSARQFWILFIVFGLTGTTTAILTRYITAWLGMDAASFWLWKLLLRIGILVFGYQAILLGYGALLGQWAFFWKYERKLLQKLGILRGKTTDDGRRTTEVRGMLFIDDAINQKSKVKSQKLETVVGSRSSVVSQTRMAIFASGAGTNAEKIIAHLKNHSCIEVSLVVCNKPGAGVLAIASANSIPTLLIEKERFFRGDTYLPELSAYGINFIVLAGFLWKIPDALIAAYPDQIINIHPALLPKYGGKGMYGMKVHEAVIAAGEKESGITIHYVNEHFDEGKPIFQASCPIEPNETPESLAQKIHALEHRHFPEVIADLLK
jgi:formyltetrahydrofolate-dependent phosphoribosylglycinamide formyltransferase